MKTWLVAPLASLCLALTAALAAAAEAPYHHVHLTATTPSEGIAWYATHMEGEAAEDSVAFGATRFLFFRRPAGFGGSSGTGVDHIGFSFPDLDAKVKELEAAGVALTAPIRQIGDLKFAFVEDPWGTRIEVMQDPELLGFHHIHLKSTDPDATFAWYQEAFGGEKTKFKGLLDAVRYGKIWLLVQPGSESLAPTQGRAIDHLGWSFSDLDAAAKSLKEKGVKFTLEPMPFRNLKIAFIEAPDGVRIELVEVP